VFLVYPGEGIGTWGRDEQSPHTEDPFAGPWNHWPVSQIRSDGRYAISNDRLTHAALGGGDTRGDMAMYGLTEKPITELVPLAKSWKHPPSIVDALGCEVEGYDKEQRAYLLRAMEGRMTFTLDASEESPVHNAALVIKNWRDAAPAGLRLNRKPIRPGRAFRQGQVRDTDGTRMMILWLEAKSTSPLQVTILKQ
jgi:hypothetical protein